MAKEKGVHSKESVLEADEFDSRDVEILISTRLYEVVLKAVKHAPKSKHWTPRFNQ